MARKNYSIQLKDHVTGEAIITSGGSVHVAQAGLPDKETLYDSAGAAATNPVSITRGKIDFWVDADTDTVDLYGIAPGGQSFQAKGVKPSGPNEIAVDTGRKEQVMVVPFAIADCTTDVEKLTGLVIPTNAMMLPMPFINVTDEQSGDTLDVGTDSGDSGDADGFMDGISIGTAGLVKATLANSAITLGTQLWVQDSANSGDEAPEGNVSQAGNEISYTMIGTVTSAAGFINLPYLLSA